MNRHTRRTGMLASAGAALLLAAGCSVLMPPPQPPARLALRYGRVAIAEFRNRTQYASATEEFAAVLREKLSQRAASTDVIVIPACDLPELGDPFTGGRVPVSVLARIRREYLADALVIGSVDEHNPYWKPSVHLSVKVIDTGTGEVPFELSQSWDAGEQQARGAIDEYYRRNYGSDDCRFGPQLFVTSPHYFLRFVADRVADRLARTLEAEPAPAPEGEAA